MAAVAITRMAHTSDDLRAEAARTKNARMSRRLLALALVLNGHSRTAAAEACAMDRQTLKHCATGCIDTTKTVSRACPIAVILAGPVI